MLKITSLFATRLYHASLSEYSPKVDPAELEQNCYAIAEDDEAGHDWCETQGYPGYTSYASLDDLAWRMPIFGEVQKALDKHVAAFCDDLGFDLKGKKLKCNALWINILPEGGTHASHIHPHSVISGTTYVAMPEGTSALKLEDQRLPMMMAAPLVQKSSVNCWLSMCPSWPLRVCAQVPRRNFWSGGTLMWKFAMANPCCISAYSAANGVRVTL